MRVNIIGATPTEQRDNLTERIAQRQGEIARLEQHEPTPVINSIIEILERNIQADIAMKQTLTDALCNQRPAEITLYTGTHKNLDAFAHIPTVSDVELSRIEADEQLRRELPVEQRITLHAAYREFADEMSDAEAESGMARIVWQVREGQFSNAQFTTGGI